MKRLLAWILPATLGVLVSATSVTAQAAQDDDTAQSAADALKYFTGSWLCTAELGEGNGFTGIMHFAPWDAWVVGSFAPQDPNNESFLGDPPVGEPPANWPPRAGHGPAIIPPRPSIGNNLTFLAYDSVAKAFVAFKFLGAGTYSMASSTGPDANGTWTWDGALSDDGKGAGALVKGTMDTRDTNAFNMVGSVSSDVGATWTETSQVRCVKQPDA